MVQRYWGAEGAEPTDFSGLVRPAEGGIRTDELTAELRERGWRAHRIRGELEVVADQVREGRPVILLIRVGPDRYHYVVVVAVTGGSVLVHDPARSPFMRLSRDELLARWEPTDRWAVLLLPPVSSTLAIDTAAAADVADSSAADVADDADAGAAAAPCAEEVEAAVMAARAGRTGRADSLLAVASRRCPDRARVHAELAGVRFRQERWEEASESALRALHLDPGHAYALRILGAARYLAGHEEEALGAWNRLGEPRLVGLRVYGLRDTRYAALRRHLGLPDDRLLTPGVLAAARRRVAALPAARTSRVSLRAPADGRAELEVALVERPTVPKSPAELAPAVVRAVTDREARLQLGSIAGAGETWAASVRWWEERPRVRARLTAPGAFGVAGVWGAEGAWERETYAVDPAAAPAPPGASAAPPSEGLRTEREERSRAAVGLSRWVSGGLRVATGVALDRWEGAGSRLGVRVGAEARDSDERLALRADAVGWEGEGPAFGALGLALAARTDPEARWRLEARAGLDAASSRAPRTEWPGAGTGRARPALLRAHPLLEEGVIAGPAFGRALAHAGLALDRSLPGVGPLSPGLGAFLDIARPWGTGGIGEPRLQADVGIGLELGVPAVEGGLRLDYARGLRDGADALTLRWAPAWPGW